MPILRRAPCMKWLNHFPNVWLLVTYCLALSTPTTVLQVYSAPMSCTFPSQVLVFRIMSHWIFVKFLPGRSEVMMVTRAAANPTLSLSVAFPSWGSKVSSRMLKLPVTDW